MYTNSQIMAVAIKGISYVELCCLLVVNGEVLVEQIDARLARLL